MIDETVLDVPVHHNRQQRRELVRSLSRPVRLAYGFGRWRYWLHELVIRTDGRP